MYEKVTRQNNTHLDCSLGIVFTAKPVYIGHTIPHNISPLAATQVSILCWPFYTG